MKQYILVILCSVSIFSCAKQEPTVKHVMKAGEGPNLKNVKVVNEDDPVCHMKTAEFLKDTAVHKGNIYGFCSDNCKKTFKKNPDKYVQK
ncbi:YHS domain-containing protein [Elizabethkingia anophelis]|uniref:YHS domain-containing protein n=1 Tax=Elizabethkingia TaxID=308865 RepID=UPI0007398CF7|nr:MULTISPECIES: YHS domain-containing protein [Elizabethkingia]KUF43820.1 ATPase P [Elizabethkingia anophelis]MCT3645825.1 YHS domain-containing protein [Elizabethkingia anophelis]MCT3653360.1 YHS domain-containing protein [Elizabethkingia anophelis]MCT3656916.1 YHS domain-containing protein [Elizabethkingia anophelis]MCT3660615.1 YHS domain-containing protein [Elizabethkingia anophelis]